MLKHIRSIVNMKGILGFIFSITVLHAATEVDRLARIKNQVAHMSIEEKIGQRMMLDFRYWCAQGKYAGSCTQPLLSMNKSIAELLKHYHIGGIILFKENSQSLKQLATLTEASQRAMQGEPGLLVGVDQEGGIVTRLPATQIASFSGNMAIAAASMGRPEIAYAKIIGGALGHQLANVGINVNFSPDIDVNSNSKNPVIHVRAFSDLPSVVATLGLQMMQGLQQAGVAATLKHFPGHGDTATDSHTGLPIVTRNKNDAWAVDLFPFSKILKYDSPDMIMTAHIQYPALDSTQIFADKTAKKIMVPATLSKRMLKTILRDKLKFKGIIISDAMSMGAISDNFSPLEAVSQSFSAGVDIALMPIKLRSPLDVVKLKNLVHALVRQVKQGKLDKKALDRSVIRILALKDKLGLLKNTTGHYYQPRTLVYEQLQSDLAHDSITLVKNKKSLLPLKLKMGDKILIAMPFEEQVRTTLKTFEELRSFGVIGDGIQLQAVVLSESTKQQLHEAIDKADIVMMGSQIRGLLPSELSTNYLKLLCKHHGKCTQDNIPLQAIVLDALTHAKKTGKKAIVMSLMAPYDLAAYDQVSDAMLAVYDGLGIQQDDMYVPSASLIAAVHVVLGVHNPTGRLPIAIPSVKHSKQIKFARGLGLTFKSAS